MFRGMRKCIRKCRGDIHRMFSSFRSIIHRLMRLEYREVTAATGIHPELELLVRLVNTQIRLLIIFLTPSFFAHEITN